MTKACQGAPSVGILVFDDVEVLDFAGPYEVLAQATRDDGAPACRVLALAPALDVRCRGGLRVRADATLDDAPPLDLLIVPGGPGTRAEGAALERLVQYVRGCARRGTTIASVCTGAFVLARAGVLDGRAATTHHDWLDRLGAGFPAVRVTGGKVVDEGAVLTAGGISSGIDLALHILERWFGPGVRSRAAERLEGAWR
ncbi:MAG TPA: DJ-1/PfpI family protein [Gemmatimonadaceae bacterium]|nr:DJ-1/PfpI family protein [Gemmatimonadaceae bacterium]